MTRLNVCGLLVLALSVVAGGCSTDFPDAPTVVEPIPTTEPLFTGTLTVNGAVTQPFLVTDSGSVELTINALADSNGPAPIGQDGLIRVGLLLGTWNGTACQVRLSNDNAFVATVVTGVATSAGPLCVRIYDVGKLTEPVTFEIKITHF
jgi:hypothetical protein